MRLIIHDINKSLAKRGLEPGGRVQKFIDSETIRQMEPYTPIDTGFLAHNAPKLQTAIGSGTIKQVAPYARRQYYSNSGQYQHGKRGKLWFERMKADHKEAILKGANEMAKRGTE